MASALIGRNSLNLRSWNAEWSLSHEMKCVFWSNEC